MDETPDRVVVVGQGYVGLPLAVRAVEQGHDVVGFDLDQDRIAQLAAGTSYIEDIGHERLGAALRSGRYLPTTDPDNLAGFDIAIISVPTPLRDGSPDLSHIESSAAQLGAHLRPGACVVLESTTYPGTTEELLAPLLEQASGLHAGDDFQLGYSPERIDPGNPTWTLEKLSAEEVRRADAVVLLVDHDRFDLELLAAEARYVLDTRRCLHGPTVEHL